MAFNIDPRYSFDPNAQAADGMGWSCIDDRTYDGTPDSKNRGQIGWGATKEEALADLERLFEEQADYWQMVHEEESERRERLQWILKPTT